jgi:hypothetical protein
MRRRSSRFGPILIVVQALWGAVLLLEPGMVLMALGGANEARTPKRILRILGARHLLQAGAEQYFGAEAFKLGACVDGLHALSGMGFACFDARWRRAALTDAAITGGFAACSLATLPQYAAH